MKGGFRFYEARIIYFSEKAVTVFIRDITTQKIAEEQLLESEERWRSLVQNAADVVFSIDINGIIQFINHTITKRSPEMVIGTSIYDYIPPKYREKLNKDKLLVIEGEIQRDEFTGNTRVLGKKILDISEARENHAKNLLIKLSKSIIKPSLLDDLKKIMSNFCPGLCLTRIVYTDPELKTQVYLTLGDNWRVKPEEDLLKALRESFGEESISIQY